jgi:hypothetical protein
MNRGLAIAAVVLAVVMVGIAIAVGYTKMASSNKASLASTIPKTIWCYWQNEMPEFISLCIERCRRLNPGYELIILNDDNIAQHLPELDRSLLEKPIFNDSAARRSDLIRCHAIAHHGGIWMDASIICMKPFDEWLDRSKDFVGFHIGKHQTHPVIESWFFASKPGSEFMRAWCREFSRLGEFGTVQEYLEDLRAAGVDISHISSPEYLAIHCAAQKVLQKQVRLSPETHTLSVAEDGPFLYLTQSDWNSTKAIKLLTDEWQTFENTLVLVKLRSVDRAVVTNDLVGRLKGTATAHT